MYVISYIWYIILKQHIMYQKMLLPNSLKITGWLILVPATLIGLVLSTTNYAPSWLYVKMWSPFPALLSAASSNWIHVKLANTIIGILVIIGGMMLSFTKEKEEDEYIANLRLSALIWAVIINYILLLIAFICIYDITFFTIMIYNMFTVLLLFIIRFNFMLYKTTKLLSHEE